MFFVRLLDYFHDFKISTAQMFTIPRVHSSIRILFEFNQSSIRRVYTPKISPATEGRAPLKHSPKQQRIPPAVSWIPAATRTLSPACRTRVRFCAQTSHGQTNFEPTSHAGNPQSWFRSPLLTKGIFQFPRERLGASHN